MRGHDAIILMRLDRVAPGIVFLNDWPCETDWAEWGECATVCTAGDAIALLDLRFLFGLRVSVSSDSEARAKLLFDACKAAGVKMVIALHIDQGKTENTWGRMWVKPVAAPVREHELETMNG